MLALYNDRTEYDHYSLHAQVTRSEETELSLGVQKELNVWSAKLIGNGVTADRRMQTSDVLRCLAVSHQILRTDGK